MFTAKERQRYNEDRVRACKRLGITVNQYNWFRREGVKLHKLFEDDCNGIEVPSRLEGDILTAIRSRSNGLYLYIQSDPRGEAIYLDTKAIPENNYTQAVCIY